MTSVVKLGNLSRGRPLEERFWERVEMIPFHECWEWTGAIWNGYGTIKNGQKPIQATHLSLRIAGRPLPSGMFACHHCDNRSCVRPSHLFHGTHLENLDDMIRKGRNRCSPRQSLCKRGHPLSEDNICFIQGERRCKACRRIYARRYYMARAQKIRDLA